MPFLSMSCCISGCNPWQLLSQLRELKDLKDAGVLSDTESEEQKALIIEELKA